MITQIAARQQENQHRGCGLLLFGRLCYKYHIIAGVLYLMFVLCWNVYTDNGLSESRIKCYPHEYLSVLFGAL